MRQQTRHPILAIDPGLRELGIAALTGRRILASDVLALRDIPPAQRGAEVSRAVEAWTRAYRPRTLVLEQTPRRGASLARLGRRLRRLARRQHLRLAVYSPKAVRKSVVGDGWASKRDVAAALSARYRALRVYRTQDRKWKEAHWHNMYDAIALGIHHQSVSSKPSSRSR